MPFVTYRDVASHGGRTIALNMKVDKHILFSTCQLISCAGLIRICVLSTSCFMTNGMMMSTQFHKSEGNTVYANVKSNCSSLA